jgi:hypothetical protein
MAQSKPDLHVVLHHKPDLQRQVLALLRLLGHVDPNPDTRQPQAGEPGADATPTGHHTADPLACPRCAYPGPHTRAPGAGPHYARLVCGRCGRYLCWLPKPRPVAQEVRP